MGWIERARREISKDAGQGTAITAEGNLTSVTAVTKAGETEITGIPLDDLRAHAGKDWPEIESNPAVLECFADIVAIRRMREKGVVPPSYTRKTVCAGCGPVPIYEGVGPTVEGCPWCFNRAAGRPVPRAV
jgi:hypothetical protein